MTASRETSAPLRRNSRLLWYRVLLLLGSTIVSLALAELLCRVLVPPQSSIRFQQDIDELDGMRLHDAAQMIRNDPELFWRLKPDTRIPEQRWPFFGVISNGQSLREDHEIPAHKPAGQTRILFLGDSCTFGYGVAHDSAFVAVAESLLKRKGSDVECINAGVPGYSLFQGYRYLVTEGLDHQPDLVVLNFGWNDAGQWDHLGDREHHEIIQAMQPPSLLRPSRLCQLIWGRIHKPRRAEPGAPRRPRLLPAEFSDILGLVHAELEQREIPMLVLVWPMRMNSDPSAAADARTPLQWEMSRFGSSHPVSEVPPVAGLLDLVPLGRDLVARHGVNAIYYDQGHVTPLAHHAIAEALVRHIGPWLTQ